MVLSRKSGESIVIGPMAFTNLIEAVPSPPVAGGTKPSSSGGGDLPPCQAVAARPRVMSGDRGGAGPVRRRDWLTDRPPWQSSRPAESSGTSDL